MVPSSKGVCYVFKNNRLAILLVLALKKAKKHR